MQMLSQDLRYGARMLLKRPGFTLVAVITLALGIGANTAIFSVINAVLLRALPYHNGKQLVMLFAADATGQRDVISLAEAQDFAAQMTTLDDFAAFQSQSVNLTGLDQPERVRGGFVTASFFEVFNLSPVIGRTFAHGEDQPGAERVAVVNEGFWQRHLNSDPDLTGKKVILNGEPYSVIGVVTSAFKQPLDAEVEVWMTAQRFPGNTGQRDARYLFGIGHLKPNVSLEQMQAEAQTVAAQMAQVYPNENAGRSAKAEMLGELLVRDIRPILLVLFAAVGCILLIACANLANLTMARGAARLKEFALRAALGAGRWRLVRQLLTETTLLALLGGGLGLLIASWGIDGLLAVNPGLLPPDAVHVETRVLLFTLGASVFTGIVFGLAPALQLSRVDLHTALKEGGRASSEGAGARRARSVFVVVQVALSLVLLVGGALLIKSFYKLLQVDPGFKPANLLTFEYRTPRNKYSKPDAQWEFHRQVVERLKEVPGIESAALVRGLPFSGNGQSVRILLPDREAPPKGQEPQVLWNTATPGFFETIGIPFIQGRLFDSRDQLNTPVVFVINQTMARRFWPDQDPIGKPLKMAGEGTTGTVIGVVGDARQYYLSEEQQPQVYDCYSQFPGLFATVVARTSVEPMSLAQAARDAVWKVDKDQPVWKVRSEEFLLTRNVADKRFLMLLMGIFAALALSITAIGLYGVVSYTVGQRTQEIGIRMALGARTHDILAMILRQGMRMVLIGLAVGLAAAFALTRLMASLLYGTSAADPLAFAAIALLLAGVALVACFVPARRATRVDPMVALRYE
jgi:putative ABC transport system permease protein